MDIDGLKFSGVGWGKIKKYVDDSILAEDFWDRTGTTIVPNTAGDSLDMGSRVLRYTIFTYYT